MLTADDYDWAVDILGRAAATVARRWPGIDREDIYQEMWAGILPNFEQMPRDDDYLFKAACNAGNKYAAGERDYYSRQSAQWVYTPGEVRGLFKEAFFDPTCWEAVPTEATSESVRSGGVVVALWDLQRVWLALSDAQRDVIALCYRDTPWERHDDATRKRLQRAIDAATRLLNGRMSAARTTEYAIAA